MVDLLASFKTDDIKNELDVLRDSLLAKQSEFSNVYVEFQTISGHLSNMESKVTFVIAQLEQINALTTPEPPSLEEALSDKHDKTFRDPIFLASSGLAISGVALLGIGGLAKKLGGVAKSVPKITATTKATKLTKAQKVMKLGKGSVVLSGAIAIIELVVSTASAQTINAELNRNKATLEKSIKEANEYIAEAKSERKEANAHLMDLLRDAEVDHLIVETEDGPPNLDPAIAAYLRQMNEMIVELGKQKSSLRMMRKMLLAGMDSATSAGIAGTDVAVAQNLATRIMAERALVAGDSPVEAARKTGLDPSQVGEIAKVVQARGDIIAGEIPETVAQAFDVPLEVVIEEASETMPLLARHWETIEGSGDLSAVAHAVVVPVAALERLRAELVSKLSLASGGDISAIAKSAERPVEDIHDWNVELAEARGRLADMERDGVAGGIAGLAAHLRLPLELASASP